MLRAKSCQLLAKYAIISPMRVTAVKMAAGGRCIARVDGKAVFVSGLLPGEVADVSITARCKDYDEADVVSLLEASPYRIEPACPAASECGGCSLMIATHEGQRKFKREILQDLLHRANCEYSCTIEEIDSKPFEYRSRFQFHKDASGQAGFCAKGSGQVVPLRDCPVAVPEARSLLVEGRLKSLIAPIAKERFNVFSFGGKTLIEGEGSNIFSLDFCGKKLEFDIRSFFQSNVPAFEKTAKAVFEALEESLKGARRRRFLDLYSGSGVFSLLASGFFDELFLVEENPLSARAAKANLTRNAAGKAKANVFAQRDSEWVKAKCAQAEFDAAVIDPPRGGIGKRTMQWLLTAKIGKLAYLSCSAPTFARDAALLAFGGWHLHRIVLCDFYPQTPHMEVLGFFSRGRE